MRQQEILELLEKLDILQRGHFKLTSGLHSEEYMQCAKIFEYPKQAQMLVAKLVSQLPKDIETIIAPAVGGITIGYEVASQLNCRFIFAERQAGAMTWRRGFNLSPAEKVFVVEDVVTTGGSVQEVIELAQASQGEVLGVAALVDRSQGKANFQVPFISLVNMEINVYERDYCPLCAKEIPLTQPGSRMISR